MNSLSPEYDQHPVIFYDGSCPLCRREIDHYRRVDHAGSLHWLDISGDPDSLARYGLTFGDAMAELHALDASGQWQRGVDAFLVIWNHLPRYRWLARLISVTGLHRPLRAAYRRFALWRYRRRCDAGGCGVTDRSRV